MVRSAGGRHHVNLRLRIRDQHLERGESQPTRRLDAVPAVNQPAVGGDQEREERRAELDELGDPPFVEGAAHRALASHVGDRDSRELHPLDRADTWMTCTPPVRKRATCDVPGSLTPPSLLPYTQSPWKNPHCARAKRRGWRGRVHQELSPTEQGGPTTMTRLRRRVPEDTEAQTPTPRGTTEPSAFGPFTLHASGQEHPPHRYAATLPKVKWTTGPSNACEHDFTLHDGRQAPP